LSPWLVVEWIQVFPIFGEEKNWKNFCKIQILAVVALDQRVGANMLLIEIYITRSIFLNYKQLLDEVFVISRIIKVKVGVISRNRRLRLITLTETLYFLDITPTESNNCFIMHWTKKMDVMFLLLHWWQATQIARTWHDYLWPWVPLTWLFYNLQRWCHRHWFQKFTVCFRPIRKEIVSLMYNKLL